MRGRRGWASTRRCRPSGRPAACSPTGWRPPSCTASPAGSCRAAAHSPAGTTSAWPEIDAAIGELTRRSLIRRLPDGQLYRASAAEYLIPLEGVGGLSTRLDPMGGEISCTARHVSLRAAPQDVAWSLGGRRGEPGPHHPVRLGGGGRAGRHLHRLRARGPPPGPAPTSRTASRRSCTRRPAAAAAEAVRARAVDLELAPPQPSVARSLRLMPGQPAISVTIRFDDRPRALRPA